MAKGSDLSDSDLAQLGVSRGRDEFGKLVYFVPCIVCGKRIGTRQFTTERMYKCNTCKSEIAKKNKAKVKAAREDILSILAEDLGTDYDHLKRFENGSSKFGKAYSDSIEKARKAIDRFDSVPEVVACIELINIGARVIVHQRVGDFTVDFCLPDEKLVIEIDGSIYHRDDDKTSMRDYAVTNMLGDGWIVRHIPAEAVTKNHEAFGRGMGKLLKSRREELREEQ